MIHGGNGIINHSGQANRRHSLNAVSMLGQRRRHWTNIGTSVSECGVSAGKHHQEGSPFHKLHLGIIIFIRLGVGIA